MNDFNEFVERMAYGFLSAVVGSLIAMSILWWIDGEYSFKFFMMFIIPAFILGAMIGKNFFQSMWNIFREIW